MPLIAEQVVVEGVQTTAQNHVVNLVILVAKEVVKMAKILIKNDLTNSIV